MLPAITGQQYNYKVRSQLQCNSSIQLVFNCAILYYQGGGGGGDYQIQLTRGTVRHGERYRDRVRGTVRYGERYRETESRLS